MQSTIMIDQKNNNLASKGPAVQSFVSLTRLVRGQIVKEVNANYISQYTVIFFPVQTILTFFNKHSIVFEIFMFKMLTKR